jgi:hypothetical protein
MTRDLNVFSANYQQARQKFLDAARLAGAEIEHLQNTCPGVGGAGLYTDVALLGPRDAPNLLVIMSGTHGVEGFAGSAIQTSLLAGDLASRLTADVRVVMVHALNPYGFAFLRRVNEDNVDLNRNFITDSAEAPVNDAYRRLANVIAPRSLTWTARLRVLLTISLFRLLRGHDALQEAVTQGQYAYPDGLFFGGRAATWSNRTLHDISARHLSRARRVIVIDCHTGLGSYGMGEVIVNDPADAPVYRRAVSLWGKEIVKSTNDGQSVSSRLTGTVKMAFERMLPESEVTAVGLEFGTEPPMQVFWALQAENWLHHWGQENHPDAAQIKMRLLRVFYPEDQDWRRQVLEQGERIVDQALSGLLTTTSTGRG